MDIPHLVTLSQNGDEMARSELLDLAARLVYARVARSVRPESDAEDVAQDALLATLAALGNLANPARSCPGCAA